MSPASCKWLTAAAVLTGCPFDALLTWLSELGLGAICDGTVYHMLGILLRVHTTGAGAILAWIIPGKSRFIAIGLSLIAVPRWALVRDTFLEPGAALVRYCSLAVFPPGACFGVSLWRYLNRSELRSAGAST